jgi:hypothetical protein
VSAGIDDFKVVSAVEMLNFSDERSLNRQAA